MGERDSFSSGFIEGSRSAVFNAQKRQSWVQSKQLTSG